MERWARGLALATALIGWAALGLQLCILVDRMGAIGPALWRFLGYFTLLTNLMVAVVASAMALCPKSALAGPKARLAALTSIVLVGVVYGLLLRNVWTPTGWQKIADLGLHDVVPPLFALAWLLGRHGGLAFRDIFWAVAPGLVYLVYALTRGAADGWYAYWFLNPDTLGTERLALNIVRLAAGFLLAGTILVAADRALARRR